jgi:hypothetical protein
VLATTVARVKPRSGQGAAVVVSTCTGLRLDEDAQQQHVVARSAPARPGPTSSRRVRHSPHRCACQRACSSGPRCERQGRTMPRTAADYPVGGWPLRSSSSSVSGSSAPPKQRSSTWRNTGSSGGSARTASSTSAASARRRCRGPRRVGRPERTRACRALRSRAPSTGCRGRPAPRPHRGARSAGRRAPPQAGELREDEPHPVAVLRPRAARPARSYVPPASCAVTKRCRSTGSVHAASLCPAPWTARRPVLGSGS